ncbi:hypothetical protein Rumeso_00049 [Rubellimicrobium mesophilum DSM 19309]|uniref:Uncharacterized protein n=1 Tax=Rubellimicrobium mesophilum DSM 19309 TaxID=442562 RepID=A0A017HVK6_9RHOB|nr:Gfo/Idh/MocA family oxidoreductase [Rubellimicrobium mesophilum]EYD78360.1 hypothetical protein Rumeso_00049 [Rubellimicrobium mesophilum DSM 19309]
MGLRLGVLGTGRMASTMMGAVASLPALTVAGVASPSGGVERAQSFAASFGIGHAYGDVESLLARDDIDIVYIATETSSHARLSLAALEAGKSVLCEKPFASSFTEARSVVEAARRSKNLFMEAVWTLLLPAYGQAEEIVGSGRIGRPAHLTASFGYPVPRSGAQVARGGVLLDRAVYPVSLAVKLLGPVQSVVAATIIGEEGQEDAHASLQLVHASGAHSQLAVSAAVLLSNTAVISGSEGSVTLEAPLLGSEWITIRRSMGASQAGAVGTPPFKQRLKMRLRSVPLARRVQQRLFDGRREHQSYGGSQYRPLLDHFVALVESGTKESGVVPLDLSLEVARVIDQARTIGNSSRAQSELMP